VVGCGNIGSRHLAILSEQGDARVSAFCDIDPRRLESSSTQHPTATAYPSIGDLLARDDADVVNICTPHYLHADHAIAALEAGRHVLVEKPMCLTTGDADRMIAAARKAGRLLMVVKQNRYNKPVALLRAAMDEGRLGRILMAQCNVIWNRYADYYRLSPWLGRRAMEGGALFTQVSHFLDLLVLFCGDVVGATGRVGTKLHAIETEDCGTASLEFTSGALGSLFWTTCAYHRNVEGSLTIVGERGTVRIGGQYLNRIEHWDVEGSPLADDIAWTDRPNAYGAYQGSSSNHDKVFADVIRRVRREDVRVVGGEEARRTVAAIETIYRGCSASAAPLR
jgi:predicted dehydrogenase